MVRMKSAMPFSSFPAALLVAAGWAAAQHDFENTAEDVCEWPFAQWQRDAVVHSIRTEGVGEDN
jgi:hypothetical protein